MTIATLLFALITATNVGASGEPVLLDFQASWCGPCRQMRPVIDELIRGGLPVKKIDIDESPDLAAKYEVTAVPTFIVVSRSGQVLGRTSGAQPAGQLAALYREAKAKIRPKAPPPEAEDEQARAQDEEEPPAQAGESRRIPPEDPPAPRRVNPKPWETCVRIKIDTGQGLMGFGSGTIIYSSPKEAIILTCAHIFKLEGRRQAGPAQFPGKITVDLFDGKLSSMQVPQVHYANESYAGEAIDYDFGLDVGLIRIRPGKRLPASRVVPPFWQPKARMRMHTVGCSEGRDATAWSTVILNPKMRGALTGHAGYEAIECLHAPKQGRSGGGLYTEDGYVAGVCDFAEPRGDHGLYASPTSIYKILDRNNLMALYEPGSRAKGTLVADGRPSRPRRSTAPVARAQSPDHEENQELTIPPPQLLGIALPEESDRQPASAKGRRTAWHPILRVATSEAPHEKPEEAEIKMTPVGDDEFAPIADERTDREDEPAAAAKPRPKGTWRPAKPSRAR